MKNMLFCEVIWLCRLSRFVLWDDAVGMGVATIEIGFLPHQYSTLLVRNSSPIWAIVEDAHQCFIEESLTNDSQGQTTAETDVGAPQHLMHSVSAEQLFPLRLREKWQRHKIWCAKTDLFLAQGQKTCNKQLRRAGTSSCLSSVAQRTVEVGETGASWRQG